MSEHATTMNIDANLVIQLRNQQAWSQHHLAEVCGLSLRTIQRVEKESRASQETVKALASVFELQPGDLLAPEVENNLADMDVTLTAPAAKPAPSKVKFLVIASAFMAIFSAAFWVPMTSASGVKVIADEAFLNGDNSETFAGNVSISIPFSYNTEITGNTMNTVGNASYFEGEVTVQIALNGYRYQMHNAVVSETDSGIRISTDAATLVHN